MFRNLLRALRTRRGRLCMRGNKPVCPAAGEFAGREPGPRAQARGSSPYAVRPTVTMQLGETDLEAYWTETPRATPMANPALYSEARFAPRNLLTARCASRPAT